jgi:ABC-2 type transport system permease protein
VTGVLVRLRLTIWRRTPNSMRWVGVTIGVGLALGALAVGAGELGGRGSSGDLLAIVFAAWLVGWIAGPVQTGGSEFLRPEWFAMLPVRTRRLAAGLLTATMTSLGTAITVVTLAALVVYAARSGPEAVAVAVVAVPLLLALMVLASRIAAEALGSAAKSRVALEVASLQYGLFIAAMLIGWAGISILVDIAGEAGAEFSDLLPGWLSTTIRVLPSGWGVVAVDAAGRGDWALAGLALAGLVAVVPLALLLWARLLRDRMTGARTGAAARARSVSRRRRLPATPLGAVIGKDLRTWSRDPRRGVEIRSSLWAAAFTTAGVWAFAPDLLPFAGVVVALIGAMACVNVYAMDGTALWLTLLAPGAERADVRGRQIAWLLIFAPASVLPTVLGLAVAQAGWAVPWVAALLPALLGGAAGLIPLLSVYWLAPETDAHKRTGNPAETGTDATGLYLAMLLTTVLAAGPVVVLLAVGEVRDAAALTGAAVPVGVATGVGGAWWFGRLAADRLRSHGAELLQLMRVGPASRTSETATAEPSPLTALPAVQRQLFNTCLTLGVLALAPQALAPTVMKLTGNVAQSWFLALHVPEPWQWPVIVGMVVLGAALLWAAWAIYQRARRLDSARVDQAQDRATA